MIPHARISRITPKPVKMGNGIGPVTKKRIEAERQVIADLFNARQARQIVHKELGEGGMQ